jgi:hypothetical protein
MLASPRCCEIKMFLSNNFGIVWKYTTSLRKKTTTFLIVKIKICLNIALYLESRHIYTNNAAELYTVY